MRLLLAALFVLSGVGSAAAADLKLLTAGAFKSVAQELVPEFEKKTGHKVTIENDTAGALARRVAAGEYFDVVVMPPGAMAPLLGSKLVESSAKALARVGIGVSIKQGAPVPDISTVDASSRACSRRAPSPIPIRRRAARPAPTSPTCSKRWASPPSSSPRPCW